MFNLTDKAREYYKKLTEEKTNEYKGKDCRINDEGKRYYNTRKYNDDEFVITAFKPAQVYVFGCGTCDPSVTIKSLNRRYKTEVDLEFIDIIE